LLGAAVFHDFSDFLAAGCNIGFQVLRPGLVLLRLAQGWSLEAVCRAVPFRFSSMSRCDSLPPASRSRGHGGRASREPRNPRRQHFGKCGRDVCRGLRISQG
jgi:hypothetical protein